MKAVVNVDCSVKLGAYSKTFINNNWCDSHHFHESYYSDIEFMKKTGIEFDKFRIWINPKGWYDFNTGNYRFERYYRYLEGASRVSNSILIDTGSPIKTVTLEEYRNILKTGLKYYKERFPKIKFIECLNEVDLEETLDTTGYYEFYKVHYTVINEINDELNPEIPLQVGGPVAYRFDRDFIKTFLDNYKNDTNSSKRLDFISYHQYGRQDEELIREDNIAAVGKEREEIEGWLLERGLPADIPSFITEIGVFPGANGTEDCAGDMLTQAAGMAEMNYYYSTSSELNVPFQWAVRHKTNERKDMLAKDFTEKLTPYGNVLKMQSMLKATKIQSISDGLTQGGIGVGSVATIDDSSIAIMLWNYQWTKTDGPSYETTVNIKNLPHTYDGKSLRVKVYLIDDTHSNYIYNINNANLQKVKDVLLSHKGEYTENLTLSRNAICLIEISSEYSEYNEDRVYSWVMKENGAIADTEGIDDNNYESYVNLEGDGVHIQYDLGGLKTVKSLGISFYDGDKKVMNYDISKYNEDGSGWTKILSAVSSGNTTEMEHYCFEPIKTRYVKIIGHCNNVDKSFNVSEIKIDMK